MTVCGSDCFKELMYAADVRELRTPRGRKSDKNVKNLHVQQWKIVALHALHVQFSIFVHLEALLVQSTTWNDLYCNSVDDVTTWRQIRQIFSSNLQIAHINLIRQYFCLVTKLILGYVTNVNRSLEKNIVVLTNSRSLFFFQLVYPEGALFRTA